MTSAMNSRRFAFAAGRAPLSRKGFAQNPFTTTGANAPPFGD
jgi:hypothetical protein